MPTKINWADETLNPLAGCRKISSACDNCYAEKMAKRLAHIGWATGNQHLHDKYSPTVDHLGCWTGKISLDIAEMQKIIKWNKPRRIFLESMGDLFHPEVPFEFLNQIFKSILKAPQHTYMILTKRPARMLEYFHIALMTCFTCGGTGCNYCLDHGYQYWRNSPYPNVWLGVTVEDQQRADERIPLLLQTPAAVRFLSCEPLLGPVQLQQIRDKDALLFPLSGEFICDGLNEPRPIKHGGINWVIAGGESGHNARPMKYDWAYDLSEQCEANKVPFFYKQGPDDEGKVGKMPRLKGIVWDQFPMP